MVTLLSDILDSKQPADLLAFMLVAPLRSFSVKELAARLHTTSAKIQSAARVLERNNYLKSFSKNQTKFYMLNMRHAHALDLREECLSELGAWPDELFSSLKKLGQMSGIYLSGLFVGRVELPVDLLLVGKVSGPKLEQFLVYTDRLIGSELNYSVMSVEEFAVRRDTFDRFIKDIFDYPHLVVLDRAKQGTVRSEQKSQGPASPKSKVKSKSKTKAKVSRTSAKKPKKAQTTKNKKRL
jgi:hypothetical protein